MKTIWIKSVPFNKKVITTALESGADAVFIPRGYTKKVKELGIIKTVSEDGDIKIGKDVVEVEIKSKQDEEKIIKLSRGKMVVVRTANWKIIPLENLIAQTKGLIAEVKNSEEAKTAMGILEKGVDGVLLDTVNMNEIKKTVRIIKESAENLKLDTARIINVRSLPMGDRVCVDTCTNMKIGEGMLVGNNSSGFFLVHSESIETPYVAPRPFRVNAGGVHAYVMTPSGKTKYLSEIKTGDEIMIINHKGTPKTAVVGRAKIEKRPMMLVEARCGREKISLVLQNAETIRLTAPSGKPVSIVKLNKKSKVLVYIQKSGRHFGIKVDETITEK
ncbi:MAG: 3-dehydroquinate synthase II [bacterium]